jgi:hypothetical protein
MPALDLREETPALTREQVLARCGVEADELDEICALGIVTPSRSGGVERYGRNDVAILDVVGRARSMGLTRALFPTRDLLLYRSAMSELVGREARLFARRLKGKELPQEPQVVIEAAVQVMGTFWPGCGKSSSVTSWQG